MEDVSEVPGSVVLQPKSHTFVTNEFKSRNEQMRVQRFEMSENGYKRTRHPFSGYKELLFYDRGVIPKTKMTKRDDGGLADEMMRGGMTQEQEQRARSNAIREQNRLWLEKAKTHYLSDPKIPVENRTEAKWKSLITQTQVQYATNSGIKKD